MRKNIHFRNDKDQRLAGFLYIPNDYNYRKGTALISLHGFPSHSHKRKSYTAGRFFEDQGILFMMFDFNGSGKSEGKFEDKLLSTEMTDTRKAIDFLERNYGFKRLLLMGHSTGATIASLYAHLDSRIDKLIISGAISDLKHGVAYDFSDKQVHDFWTKGHIVYDTPGKFYYKKKLKKAYYDEFFKLDIPKAVKSYKKPLLIIHGEKDEIVPLFNTHELYKIANRPKKLVIIKGADHEYKGYKEEYFSEIMKFVKSTR